MLIKIKKLLEVYISNKRGILFFRSCIVFINKIFWYKKTFIFSLLWILLLLGIYIINIIEDILNNAKKARFSLMIKVIYILTTS